MTEYHKRSQILFSWFLPLCSISIAIFCGMLFWVVCSNNGSRLFVDVAANNLGYKVSNIEGNFLRGLKLGRLELNNTESKTHIEDIKFKFEFSSLFSGVLNISEFSIGLIDISFLKNNRKSTNNYLISKFRFPFSINIEQLELKEIVVSDVSSFVSDTAHFKDISAAISYSGQTISAFIRNLDVVADKATIRLNGFLNIRDLSKDVLFDANFTLINKYNYSVAKNNNISDFINHNIFNSTININASGSYDLISIYVDAHNKDLSIDGNVIFIPKSAFKIYSAEINLKQSDDCGSAYLKISSDKEENNEDRQTIKSVFLLDKLTSSTFFNQNFPSFIISLKSDYQVDLKKDEIINSVFNLNIIDDSKWNNNPLYGSINLALKPYPKKEIYCDIERILGCIKNLDVVLSLGSNKVSILGSSENKLNSLIIKALMPNINNFYDNFKGDINLEIDLNGSLLDHHGDISASLNRVKVNNLYKWENINLQTSFHGTYNKNKFKKNLWNADIKSLNIILDNISFSALSSLNFNFLINDSCWFFSPFSLAIKSNKKGEILLNSETLSGNHRTLETSGNFNSFMSDGLIFTELLKTIGWDCSIPGIDRDSFGKTEFLPVCGFWDVEYKDILQGNLEVKVYENDKQKDVFPVIDLCLNAKKISSNMMDINGYLKIEDQQVGSFDGVFSLGLFIDKNGVFVEREKVFINIMGDIKDISILNYFFKDNIEVGGMINCKLEINGIVDTDIKAKGYINATQLKLIRVDDGIRLVNGSLESRILNGDFIVDNLFFPANHRIMAYDAHVSEKIISLKKHIKDGYIKTVGSLNIFDRSGKFNVDVKQFPIFQRSDRYAVVSGKIKSDIASGFGKFYIDGNLVVDAGWINLESLNMGSSLDDDVLLCSFGKSSNKKDSSKTLQTKVNLLCDLGNKFYLTGLGIETSLLGSLKLSINDDARPFCLGTLRAKDGIMEIYGQRLCFNRGNITFQGSLDNPLIDIEAMRLGKQVESGIRVSGTLQQPMIDLVSYPDVSEVEKLSWLLLGRAPDDAMDLTFLLSIGGAFLSGGQPFYRLFGLSDFSIRRGVIGRSGSILPDHTVAGGIGKDAYNDLSTQFLVASKEFSNGVNLSLEQSLVGSETVARISYGLSRCWSFDIKCGSVNGIAFIYREFFEN
ncbi:conserved hypothetical protein of the DUF490 family [Candidatus Kinetoplastibacterium desouzaii TCC079E]|uniref:Translocation and assembly module TamB C-terminal domain-containing protein n=1 Tax=Candidatus Kinetoplastidibacterium desouzai TCC079E TaxID=1208919 RepID=M1LR56_9PROT|nr:translocation/assembly module TamB domain-containing protein [Candidatus Kinetoplastibacterium desouzaii]AGF46646.1 conserved hypothetical protein of the DUF490 family [Candidatus Kinetoplastibacterium desouzaii TCC079E]